MRSLLLLVFLTPFMLAAQKAYFAGQTGNTEVGICVVQSADEVTISKDGNTEGWSCLGFSISSTFKNRVVELKCQGNNLSDDAKKLITALKPGDVLSIEKIKDRKPLWCFTRHWKYQHHTYKMRNP